MTRTIVHGIHKWRHIILALAGLLALTFLTVYLGRGGGPRLGGKSVRAWSLQLHAAAASEREEAARAFHSLGAAAVPELRAQLRAQDPFARRLVWSVAPRMPGRWRLAALKWAGPLRADTLRDAAARALGAVGPAAAPAIPDLAALMRDPSPPLCFEASRALSSIGQAAVPALTSALEEHRPPVRMAAAFALSRIGPKAEAAVPELIRWLDDPNPGNRDALVACLREIGPAAHPALLETIANAEGRRRRAAAQALFRVYVPRRAAHGPLLKMLEDPDPASRRQAIEILASVPTRDPSVTSAITARLKDTDAGVREAATRALTPPGS